MNIKTCLRPRRRALPNFLALTCLFVAACGPSIAAFDQVAYDRTISLKVDALTIMDKATEPFEQHRAAVDALRMDLDKAYEYARGRPKNDLTTRQWEILRDPASNLLAGFLRFWEERSTVGAAFISNAKDLVADAFDTISGLESGKNRSDNDDPGGA